MAAVAVVLGILALVIFLASGKDEKKPAATSGLPTMGSSTSKTTKGTSEPAVPTRPPPPPIPSELKDRAKAIAATFRDLAQQGESVYAEAMKAKGEDDLETYKAKLEEASTFYHEIMDAWNEQIIADMPSNDDWNEEEVASHYFPNESNALNRAMSRFADIRKQRGK